MVPATEPAAEEPVTVAPPTSEPGVDGDATAGVGGEPTGGATSEATASAPVDGDSEGGGDGGGGDGGGDGDGEGRSEAQEQQRSGLVDATADADASTALLTATAVPTAPSTVEAEAEATIATIATIATATTSASASGALVPQATVVVEMREAEMMGSEPMGDGPPAEPWTREGVVHADADADAPGRGAAQQPDDDGAHDRAVDDTDGMDDVADAAHEGADDGGAADGGGRARGGGRPASPPASPPGDRVRSNRRPDDRVRSDRRPKGDSGGPAYGEAVGDVDARYEYGGHGGGRGARGRGGGGGRGHTDDPRGRDAESFEPGAVRARATPTATATARELTRSRSANQTLSGSGHLPAEQSMTSSTRTIERPIEQRSRESRDSLLDDVYAKLSGGIASELLRLTPDEVSDAHAQSPDAPAASHLFLRPLDPVRSCSPPTACRARLHRGHDTATRVATISPRSTHTVPCDRATVRPWIDHGLAVGLASPLLRVGGVDDDGRCTRRSASS